VPAPRRRRAEGADPRHARHRQRRATADGRFSFEDVECLASCGTAPCMQINNGAYHESLDVAAVRALLARLATE
jgi:NADH:ubiquinone oxidoreductase subunit E